MTFNIYAIKDELANTFGNLTILNQQTAQRSFKWMTQEMEKSECEDKRIYLMGKYDNETGAIEPCNPLLVYNIEEEKKHENL